MIFSANVSYTSRYKYEKGCWRYAKETEQTDKQIPLIRMIQFNFTVVLVVSCFTALVPHCSLYWLYGVVHMLRNNKTKKFPPHLAVKI